MICMWEIGIYPIYRFMYYVLDEVYAYYDMRVESMGMPDIHSMWYIIHVFNAAPGGIA